MARKWSGPITCHMAPFPTTLPDGSAQRRSGCRGERLELGQDALGGGEQREHLGSERLAVEVRVRAEDGGEPDRSRERVPLELRRDEAPVQVEQPAGESQRGALAPGEREEARD